MQSLAQNGYSEDEVLAALQGRSGARRLTFRYELLDKTNGTITELDNVLSGSVNYNFLADIKRTAKFTVLDDGTIDYLSNRIRPWVRLEMPNTRPSTDVYYDEQVASIPGLYARYKLDDAVGSTTAADSGPNSLPLAFGAGTPSVFGTTALMQNGGTSFSIPDGASCYLAANGFDPALQTNSWSVAGWHMPIDTSTHALVASSASSTWGMGIYISGGNSLYVSIPTASGTTLYYNPFLTLPANQAFFWAVTWNSGERPVIYINGSKIWTGLFSGTDLVTGPMTTATAFYIGGGSAGIGKGIHDDVSLFTRSLTSSEVNRLWKSGSLPPKVTNRPGYVEWPQGVFLLTSPTRKANETGTVTREIEAYDQLQVLQDDLVTDRYSVMAGSKYTDAVTQLLGTLLQTNVTRSSLTLPTTMEWDPGTSKLSIINALLNAINYESLYFDEYGVAVARPYVQPSSRESEYTYATDQNSVVLPSAEQTLDLFSVPNKFVLVVSDPDRTPLVSTYVNANPGSPTSTISRGRTIVSYQTGQTAPDQATLDTSAANAAFSASQVYEQITFETALMPIHSNADVYTLSYTDLGISAKYSETSWSMDLEAGSKMTHNCRRVVSV